MTSENELKFSVEIERQLRLSSSCAVREVESSVQELLAFGRYVVTPSHLIKIVDEYFDTAEEALRQMGATARIRSSTKDGTSTFERTLKVPMERMRQAEFNREEDTLALAEDEVIRARRTMSVDIHAKFQIEAEAIPSEPHLVISNQRTQFEATEGLNVFEVSIDEYTGRTGELETRPLYELEIESKSPEAHSALARLQRVFKRSLPELRPLAENKYQRALRELELTAARTPITASAEAIALIHSVKGILNEADQKELAGLVSESTCPGSKRDVLAWLVGRIGCSGKAFETESIKTLIRAISRFLGLEGD